MEQNFYIHGEKANLDAFVDKANWRDIWNAFRGLITMGRTDKNGINLPF